MTVKLQSIEFWAAPRGRVRTETARRSRSERSGILIAYAMGSRRWDRIDFEALSPRSPQFLRRGRFFFPGASRHPLGEQQMRASKSVFLPALMLLTVSWNMSAARADDGAKQLVGSWKLTGWVLEVVGEAAREPFGPNPK